jgi:hypothetical protein
VALVVKEPYPQYRVWKDHVLGCFEVARWDTPDIAVIVQTNILTREKAEAARAEWQQREDKKTS